MPQSEHFLRFARQWAGSLIILQAEKRTHSEIFLPSLLSERRRQLPSRSTSHHLRLLISPRLHPVSAIWRIMSFVGQKRPLASASRTISPRIPYSASVNLRSRTFVLRLLDAVRRIVIDHSKVDCVSQDSADEAQRPGGCTGRWLYRVRPRRSICRAAFLF